ncbi:MAG: sulfatase-like hydrolase/transferase [Planctomycetota bacterium]|jgi:arylsulfatase A-like enzyme|nr:sulfatase-like hydrolase/transferase [Planctomycetota bacterium]MDP6761838.1 sulfatase-like hydrolase/transferase [Planctomycetota bacterium]MDP6988884.1 sulfatase-like hydrolase/transferase [Planctomycetota bacterium]
MGHLRVYAVLLLAGAPVLSQEAALPRVLLIGDSISIAYTPLVEEMLAGQADVRRIPGNAEHTATGLRELEGWLGEESWDVIHFNWGLWDLCWRGEGGRGKDKAAGALTHTPEEYERNLERLVGRLENTGARLIWASTTPVPPGEPGRVEGDAARYNAVAARVMERHAVATNDLHAVAAGRMGELGVRPGDVHFNATGSRELAARVAASIRRELAIPAPNVVLVLADDLGWSDLGCTGSDFHLTPHIDALAAEGVRFTAAYAACAVCSPTRAAVLTGRYPARVGVTDWIHDSGPEAAESAQAGEHIGGYDLPRGRELLTPRNRAWLPAEEVTIAELLRPRGYATAHVGKWHLGGEGHEPTEQGFDLNAGGCSYGQPPSYFDPYGNARRPAIPHLPARSEGEYLTDREADEAVRFIEANRDRPFFLYLAHYAVHSPIRAPAQERERCEARLADGVQRRHDYPAYAAMVEGVDRAVGRVLEALEAHGLSEDTLVVFTSDNGGATHFRATDNDPLRAGKGFPYEGGLRVPMIVRPPGGDRRGALCGEPVMSIDLLPTVAEVCGVGLPQERQIDGLSLVPLLEGTGEWTRDELVWHFPHYWWGTRIEPYSILRLGRWKLVQRYADGGLELFDLGTDPTEAHDLAGERSVLAGRLAARLTELLAAQGALLPAVNPEFEARER